MSEPSNCCNPCQTVETVNIPGVEGDEGQDGTDGTDGVNAYTITSADFTIPACDATVAIIVESTAWMVVGQIIFIENAGFYEVTLISSATSVTVKNLCYEVNVPSGSVPSGSGVSPGGSQPDVSVFALKGVNSDITELTGLDVPLTVAQGGTDRSAVVVPLDTYASGTKPDIGNIGNTLVQLNFGTVDPTLTFVTAGRYRITARIRVDYAGATAANEVITVALQKTNPGSSAIPNATTSFQIVNTGSGITRTLADIVIPPVIYDALAGDVIQIWGSITSNVSAGRLDVNEADIHADPIPLY